MKFLSEVNKFMKKGFMIPFFLILVVALAAIVGSVTYLTTVGIKNVGGQNRASKNILYC